MKDLGLRGWGARWLPTGHLAYAGTDGALVAVPFDTRGLRPVGTPVALAPSTAIARNRAPAFAFSESGTLVRATGYLKGSGREPMRVVAATATGGRRVVSADADLYARGFALSPDGRRIAVSTADDTIWVIDTERGTRVKRDPYRSWASWACGGPPTAARCCWPRRRSGAATGSSEGARTGPARRDARRGEGRVRGGGWDPNTRAMFSFVRTVGVEATFMRLDPGGHPQAVFAEAQVASSEPTSLPTDASSPSTPAPAGGAFQVHVRPLSSEGPASESA